MHGSFAKIFDQIDFAWLEVDFWVETKRVKKYNKYNKMVLGRNKNRTEVYKIYY